MSNLVSLYKPRVKQISSTKFPEIKSQTWRRFIIKYYKFKPDSQNKTLKLKGETQ